MLNNKQQILISQKHQLIQTCKDYCVPEILFSHVYSQAISIIFISLLFNLSKMNIGGAFGIFIAITVVLIGLSCLLLKYYNYRHQRLLRKTSETYQICDQLYKQSEQITEGAYSEFQRRQRHQNENNLSSKLVQEDILIEMREITQKINVSNNIYGMSSLRQKLSHQNMSINSEANRSLASLKSFRFQRLNTTETSKTERKFYDFVKKLVKYNKKGITINQVFAESVKKIDGNIMLNRKLEESTTLKDGWYFQDLLQIYGFQKFNYGYNKYISSLDISDVKQNQTYLIKVLKSTERKQMIFEEEYLTLLKQIKSK